MKYLSGFIRLVVILVIGSIVFDIFMLCNAQLAPDGTTLIDPIEDEIEFYERDLEAGYVEIIPGLYCILAWGDDWVPPLFCFTQQSHIIVCRLENEGGECDYFSGDNRYGCTDIWYYPWDCQIEDSVGNIVLILP